MSMERTLPPCCMLRGCGQYNRRGVANRREGVNVNGEDSTAMTLFLHVKGYNRRGVANRREGVSTVNVNGEDSTTMTLSLHGKGVWPIGRRVRGYSYGYDIIVPCLPPPQAPLANPRSR